MGAQEKIWFSPLPNITIKYEVEKNETHSENIIKYFNAKLFKTISFDLIYMVLVAALIERSIVFVSKSKTRLSACMYTLTNMLSPLKWLHVFVTIIPTTLIDILEAPVPVLLGLTKDVFKTFDYKEITNRMWVFIDDDQIEIEGSELQEGEQYIYEPYFNNMKATLQAIAEEISKIEGNTIYIFQSFRF